MENCQSVTFVIISRLFSTLNICHKKRETLSSVMLITNNGAVCVLK